MYILFIDTVDRSQQTVILFKDTQILGQKTLLETQQLSDFLISNIKAVFTEHQLTLDSLDGILCCTGPGGFTSTRIGVAVANALAYAGQIPVIGFVKEDISALEIVQKNLKKLQKTKGFHGVGVTYDRDPNITHSA